MHAVKAVPQCYSEIFLPLLCITNEIWSDYLNFVAINLLWDFSLLETWHQGSCPFLSPPSKCYKTGCKRAEQNILFSCNIELIKDFKFVQPLLITFYPDLLFSSNCRSQATLEWVYAGEGYLWAVVCVLAATIRWWTVHQQERRESCAAASVVEPHRHDSGQGGESWRARSRLPYHTREQVCWDTTSCHLLPSNSDGIK